MRVTAEKLLRRTAQAVSVGTESDFEDESRPRASSPTALKRGNRKARRVDMDKRTICSRKLATAGERLAGPSRTDVPAAISRSPSRSGPVYAIAASFRLTFRVQLL